MYGRRSRYRSLPGTSKTVRFDFFRKEIRSLILMKKILLKMDPLHGAVHVLTLIG